MLKIFIFKKLKFQIKMSSSKATSNETNTAQQKSSPMAVNEPKKDKKRTALYSENLPTFYVGAGNNSEL